VDLRSPGYDGAINRYEIVITGGANAVSVGTHATGTTA